MGYGFLWQIQTRVSWVLIGCGSSSSSSSWYDPCTWKTSTASEAVLKADTNMCSSLSICAETQKTTKSDNYVKKLTRQNKTLSCHMKIWQSKWTNIMKTRSEPHTDNGHYAQHNIAKGTEGNEQPNMTHISNHKQKHKQSEKNTNQCY